MQNECCMIARTLLSNPSEIIKHHNFWCKDTKNLSNNLPNHTKSY